jgi:hypothetical protein
MICIFYFSGEKELSKAAKRPSSLEETLVDLSLLESM